MMIQMMKRRLFQQLMDIKIPKNIVNEAKKEQRIVYDKKKKKELYEAKEWYTIRAILGNDWCNWFVLIGAR